MTNFKVEVQEKQRLEDLVAAIFKDVKKVPVPAGGIYMQEMQRQWWPAVDNPLMQPYAIDDYASGINAAYGVALALLHRSQTGEDRHPENVPHCFLPAAISKASSIAR